jgi:RNA polymerase sigma factor (sigma-70 family)
LELTKKVIKKIKKNDNRTINELYRYSFDVLMSQVARYKNNEEDRVLILNNIFMKIIDNIDKFKADTSFKAWIRQIARNEIIDDYRRNKKRNETIEVREELYEQDTTSEIDENIEAEELEYYLNKLPPASKMVFNLYVIDGWPSKEICEKLDISYETFKWHLKEARKRLRSMFKQNQTIESEAQGR